MPGERGLQPPCDGPSAISRPHGLRLARARVRRGVARRRRSDALAPGADARSGALRGRLGRVRRADGGQLSVPPPALRGPDAQAAAPGGDRRLHRRAARQRQQPRARRRAGDERARGRGDARPGDDVRLPGRRARPPDLAAARSPTSRRCGWRASCTRTRRSRSAPTPTTRTRACAPCSASRASPPTTSRRRRAAARWGRSSSPRARPGSGPSTTSSARSALRERYGVRVHVDAAYGGFFALLDELVPVGVLPRHRRLPTASSSTRTSTACSPTAAARCCSATPASGASTSTTRRTPTSRRATCTWARSRSSARARARPPPRCG